MAVRRGFLITLAAVAVLAAVVISLIIHFEFTNTTARIKVGPSIPGELKFCVNRSPAPACVESAARVSGHTIAWLPAINGMKPEAIVVVPYRKSQQPPLAWQTFSGSGLGETQLSSPALGTTVEGVEGRAVRNGAMRGTLFVEHGPAVTLLTVVWSTRGMTFELFMSGGSAESPDRILRAWRSVHYSEP